MKNGILLIAIGQPYYGKMAYNMAMTLKAAAPDVPIALVHDDRSLSHIAPGWLNIFDVMIQSPVKTTGMEAAMELRLMMPSITPFENTLSLDVDMAWMGGKPVSELFGLLTDDCPITYINEGYFSMEGETNDATEGYLPWASPETIKKAYSLKGKLYQMRGELILFRKCKAISEVFKQAQKIRKSPAFKPHTLGGSVTEEFALNIALNKAGLAPHENRWTATFWPLINGNLIPEIAVLKDKYYALSTGGHTANYSIRRAYNIIVEAACFKIGRRHYFPLEAKMNTIPERRNN